MPKQPSWMGLAKMGLITLNQAADAGGAAAAATTAATAATAATTAAQAATATAATATEGAAQGGTAEAEKPKTVEELQAALEAAQQETEAQKRINRNLERRTKADLKEIDRLKATGATQEQAEQQVDADKIREEVRTELSATYNDALVRAALKAELAGKVADPQYAAWLLLDSPTGAANKPVISVENGNVDAQAVSDSVAELLAKNPTLKAVAQGDAATGDADQGAREVNRTSAEQALLNKLAEAEARRDFTGAIAIKQQIAALAASKKG